MSVPMVYPTYGLDEDSHAPCTEIKVDPLVEKNIDNDLNDQEVYDEDFDEEFKDPNWNLSKGKKTLLSDGTESSEGESESELEPPDTDATTVQWTLPSCISLCSVDLFGSVVE